MKIKCESRNKFPALFTSHLLLLLYILIDNIPSNLIAFQFQILTMFALVPNPKLFIISGDRGFVFVKTSLNNYSSTDDID